MVSPSQPFRIRTVRLDRRHPPVDVADLALMLEIDLAFGRPADFRRRLQRALDDAVRQGGENAGRR